MKYLEIDKAVTKAFCDERQTKFTVYFGCSRWTNANRSHAGHIAPDGGQPICGKQYRAGASDRFELTASTAKAVTCERCKKIFALNLKYGE